MSKLQRRVLFGSAAGLLLAAAAPVEAQLCYGGPSVRDGVAQLNGFAGFASGAQTFGGGLTIGSAAGLFASGSVGTTSFDGLDESTTDFAVSVGAAVPTNPAKSIDVCPSVSYEYSSLPEILGIKTSARAFLGGIAVGGTVGDPSGGLLFVPFASLKYGQVRLTVEDALDEVSGSETMGSLSLGAGMLVNHQFSIAPQVSIPINQDDSDPVFGVSVSFSLGNR